jgi:hypothetical protein
VVELGHQLLEHAVDEERRRERVERREKRSPLQSGLIPEPRNLTREISESCINYEKLITI